METRQIGVHSFFKLIHWTVGAVMMKMIASATSESVKLYPAAARSSRKSKARRIVNSRPLLKLWQKGRRPRNMGTMHCHHTLKNRKSKFHPHQNAMLDSVDQVNHRLLWFQSKTNCQLYYNWSWKRQSRFQSRYLLSEFQQVS